MKFRLLIFSLLLSFFVGSQNTYVPDDNFEQTLIDLGYDSGALDDYVLTSNINSIIDLSLDNKNISSLIGIEDFSSLTNLFCGENQLTSLDLSNNLNLIMLDCYENNLTNLNISQNINLIHLDCNNNQLPYLDVTGNVNLIDLFCVNNQLSTINTSQNINLELFYCLDNQIIDLDLSQNINLINFKFFNNQLTELDVSNNINLYDLDGFNNQLTTLDVTNNPALVFLRCDNNQLQELDIRNGNNTGFSNIYAVNNPELTCVFVDDTTYSNENWISSIDSSSTFVETQAECNTLSSEPLTYVPDDNFEQALIDLGYDSGVLDDYVPTANINTITFLTILSLNIHSLTGIEDFILLEYLDCQNNELTVLNISQNINLISLSVGFNNISDIDISQNTNLTGLYVGYNNLSDIDISQNTSLIGLECRFNNLTGIDTSQNILLSELNCYSNQITSLDFSQNINLKILECEENQIEILNLNQNTELIKLNCDNNMLSFLDIRNGNNSNIDFNTMIGFSATENPNLACVFVDDAVYSTISWVNSIDPSSTFVETQAECDALSSEPLTYVPDDNFEQALIDLGYDSGALDDYVPTANINTLIEINLDDLNILDLTGIEDFTALNTLYCRNNFLTGLDFSQNLMLDSLFCGENQLTTININNNINLTWLDVSNNQLSSIDITENTNLIVFHIDANLISNIDVSENLNLTDFTCGSNNLTSVDVSQNQYLINFFCDNNQISSLNLSNNPNLEMFGCPNNNLSFLDIRNGNNTLIDTFNSTNNPDLSCIFVDDSVYSTTNWLDIDITSTFFELESDCNTTTCSVTQVDVLNNTTDCLEYILPNLSVGNYFTNTLGAGNPLNSGDIISSSQIIYIYNVDVADNSCYSESNFEVTINPIPEVDILDNIQECNSFVLPIISNGSFYTTPFGTGNQLNSGDIITSSQIIYIYYEDPINSNCYSESSFEIEIFQSIDFQLSNSNILITNSDVLVAMDDNSIEYIYAIDNPLNYQNNNVFLNLSIGEHILYVSDVNECVEKFLIFQIESKINYQIPNFFTPNNDGKNDNWTVIDNQNLIKNIHIFNRFGKIITSILPNTQGWDGNYNGKSLPSTDYWYSINFKNGSVIKGNFTLIRR